MKLRLVAVVVPLLTAGLHRRSGQRQRRRRPIPDHHQTPHHDGGDDIDDNDAALRHDYNPSHDYHDDPAPMPGGTMRNDTTDSADEFFAKYYDVGTDLDNDDETTPLDYVLVRRTDLNDLIDAIDVDDAARSRDRHRRCPPPHRQLQRRRPHCRRPLASEPPPRSASPKYRRFASSSKTCSRNWQESPAC